MKRRFTSQVLGGLILIGIGAMFLLRQLGYTDFSLGYLISNYWPVILILMGMKRLLGTGEEQSKVLHLSAAFSFWRSECFSLDGI